MFESYFIFLFVALFLFFAFVFIRETFFIEHRRIVSYFAGFHRNLIFKLHRHFLLIWYQLKIHCCVLRNIEALYELSFVIVETFLRHVVDLRCDEGYLLRTSVTDSFTLSSCAFVMIYSRDHLILDIWQWNRLPLLRIKYKLINEIGMCLNFLFDLSVANCYPVRNYDAQHNEIVKDIFLVWISHSFESL